eukprot:TRINITY_DN28143_c0_g1_i1.p1 TRINITY_DN28143_c0_g1~~TRINITY_DN28143_c0_g1_i1.p1  ORF type:complete len:109 (+),score=13.52 TRINITY_DN28143_c0_g1_i1:205-531(+)
MKTPSRYTYDKAADHVYLLLLKKDCYPRFIRSEHYKTCWPMLSIQEAQEKGFSTSRKSERKSPKTIHQMHLGYPDKGVQMFQVQTLRIFEIYGMDGTGEEDEKNSTQS